MNLPSMKIHGTVLWPVISARESWTSAPSSMVSNSNKTTLSAGTAKASNSKALVALQCGQKVFAAMKTGFWVVNALTLWTVAWETILDMRVFVKSRSINGICTSMKVEVEGRTRATFETQKRKQRTYPCPIYTIGNHHREAFLFHMRKQIPAHVNNHTPHYNDYL